MSTINTTGINVNFPVPGENNSTQGFRTNFTAIKNNLDIVNAELTDLQNKAVLKGKLNLDAKFDNNLDGTLVSNALTRCFRSSSYNLGNALSGTVLIDVTKGDVQYGSVSSNINITFDGWSKIGENKVKLELAISNANASITFPTTVKNGTSTIENQSITAGATTIIPHANATQLDFTISSNDSGNTIAIEPNNRPRKTTQIQLRTPPPTGVPGDRQGAISVDANYMYVCGGNFNSTPVTINATATSTANVITITNTTDLVTNAPVIFTGDVFGGVTANVVYYIKTVTPPYSISISPDRTSGNAGAELQLTSATGTMTGVSYNGTDIWKRVSLTTW